MTSLTLCYDVTYPTTPSPGGGSLGDTKAGSLSSYGGGSLGSRGGSLVGPSLGALGSFGFLSRPKGPAETRERSESKLLLVVDRSESKISDREKTPEPSSEALGLISRPRTQEHQSNIGTPVAISLHLDHRSVEPDSEADKRVEPPCGLEAGGVAGTLDGPSSPVRAMCSPAAAMLKSPTPVAGNDARVEKFQRLLCAPNLNLGGFITCTMLSLVVCEFVPIL